jgi:cobaltochelatase CobN
VILFLSNADTELLALRVAIESLPPDFPAVRAGNPDRLAAAPSLDGVDAVIVRLLSGRKAWDGPFDALRAECVGRGVPLFAFGGEAMPDAELTGLSTVASATIAEAFPYLVHGGPANIASLLQSVAGRPAAAPVEVPETGIYRERGEGPLVGVVFYRSHLVAGNTQFVDDLCGALERRGARARAVWCYSLRDNRAALDALRGCRAIVTTVLAAGAVGAAGADDGDDGWTNPLAALDVPIVQAIAATSASEAWAASAAGVAPIDVAMQVAIPEFDGRIITVPFSFKEIVDDGDDLGAAVNAYRTVADRVERVAGVRGRRAGAGRRVGPAPRRGLCHVRRRARLPGHRPRRRRRLRAATARLRGQPYRRLSLAGSGPDPSLRRLLSLARRALGRRRHRPRRQARHVGVVAREGRRVVGPLLARRRPR